MKKVFDFIKKDAMVIVSVIAALLSFIITPPSLSLFASIDWKTLATLLMLLCVLDGFKSENLFAPIIRFSDKIGTVTLLSFFLVFGVFFSSMFVTNDVSLIIFVPLTMILYRGTSYEDLILPMLTLENIAAVRGSLLTPFGSPQNLFLFSNSGIALKDFLLMMLPLSIMSIVLISAFILFINRKDIRRKTEKSPSRGSTPENVSRLRQTVYIILFVTVIACIVTRTAYWQFVTAFVIAVLLVFDIRVFARVDYGLLLTFFCFFIFSSSIASNEKIAEFLRTAVAGKEYLWSIGISQIISNVPAAIVLWPFTTDLRALIYGLDSAGLVTVIGSLASVINLRLYVREYPGQGKKFIVVFEKISICFFIIVFLLQYLFMK